MIPHHVQCQEESQRHRRCFNQAVKALEEEEEQKIHRIATEYQQKLQAEEQTKDKLRGEVSAIAQNVS